MKRFTHIAWLAFCFTVGYLLSPAIFGQGGEQVHARTAERVTLSDADRYHFQALVNLAEVKRLELERAAKERDDFYAKLWKDSGLLPADYDLDWEKGVFVPKVKP